MPDVYEFTITTLPGECPYDFAKAYLRELGEKMDSFKITVEMLGQSKTKIFGKEYRVEAQRVETTDRERRQLDDVYFFLVTKHWLPHANPEELQVVRTTQRRAFDLMRNEFDDDAYIWRLTHVYP